MTDDERKIQEKANIEFSLDLYKKLATSDNFVFSPFSVSTVLAMTYAGAGDDSSTKKEMKKRSVLISPTISFILFSDL